MAVKIRLRRTGRKKQTHFRIVVAEGSKARDGRIVEQLGHYRPIAEPARLVLDLERVDYWIEQGAKPSDTVRGLINRARKGGDEKVVLGEETAEEREARRREERAAKREAEKAAREEAKSEAEAEAAEAAEAEAAEEEAAAEEEEAADEEPAAEAEAADEEEAEDEDEGDAEASAAEEADEADEGDEPEESDEEDEET